MSTSRKPKHPRRSTGSDGDPPASPDKNRSTKRRKVDHVDDGIATSFLKKIQAAEESLKSDIAACEKHMAIEEAEYAAAMERIVSARREASIWQYNRRTQFDAVRRELMAQQQDSELAAEMARIRLRRAQEAKDAKDASARESSDIRHERKKRRNAELRRAEEERAARQQPEIILQGDLCYISDLDDEFMDAEDEPASSISEFDDQDSVYSASVHSRDESEDEHMGNTTARPGNIDVDEGGESDLEIEDLVSNHSDLTDDSSRAPTVPSFKSHLKAAQAEARARQEILERQARARAEAEQAYAERERLRREREWRSQQEATRREQQEQLKREQERIKKERQERTKREFEQREWERQQQRRAEGSTSRRSMDASSGAIAAAWTRYTSQWNKLQGTGAPGRQAADAILYFSNIPWPTIRSPRQPEDISKEAVAALVLSPSHSPEKSTKARLRELLLLWHPDKFVGRWMTFVVPSDREDVTEGVMAVARIANELLAERSL